MNIAVIGIGNPLLGDDGFGVETVRRLKESGELPDIEILDGGSIGLYLLPYLADKTHIIIVDIVQSGKQPGQMIRLKADRVPTGVFMKLSEHQVTFHEVLALMGLLKIRPDECIIIGVEPKSNIWGDSLSPEVASSIDLVIKDIKAQVRLWQDDSGANI
ncbi:MAG: HyaD/HybD family hydrogenase maturation endopeptidase [Calditrichia bacterium]